MIRAEHAGAIKKSKESKRIKKVEEKDKEIHSSDVGCKSGRKSRREWNVPFLFSVFSKPARDTFCAENRLTREDYTHKSRKKRKEGRKKKTKR